jgi:hypothetical protein
MKKSFLCVFIIITMVSLLMSGCQEQQATKKAPEAAKPLKTEAQKPKVEAAKPAEQPKAAEKPVVFDPNAAAIKFEKVEHDYGDLAPDTTNLCEFKFKNTGKSILKCNKRIQVTCGCTVPELAKTDYEPGEEGVVKVSFHASQMPGATVKHLYLMSNDPNNPKVELTLKANVKINVAYEPSTLSILLNKPNGDCNNIKIRSLDGKAFSVKSLVSSDNAITAQFDPNQQATEFELKPLVNLETAKNQTNGVITIVIDHPQTKSVLVTYNVVPEFETNPRTIVLLKMKAGEPINRKIWVLNNYNDAFEIESITSAKGHIKCLSQQKVGNRYEMEVQIIPPAQDAASPTFTDTIIITTKDGKKAEIGCRGFYHGATGSIKK